MGLNVCPVKRMSPDGDKGIWEGPPPVTGLYSTLRQFRRYESFSDGIFRIYTGTWPILTKRDNWDTRSGTCR